MTKNVYAVVVRRFPYVLMIGGAPPDGGGGGGPLG